LYNYQLRGFFEYSYETWCAPHIQSKKRQQLAQKFRNAAVQCDHLEAAVVVGQGQQSVDSEPYKDAQHGITENETQLWVLREQLEMANVRKEIKCERNRVIPSLLIIVPTEKEKKSV